MTLQQQRERIEGLAVGMTPGPWSWWTSNSVRRLTAEGGPDGGVLYAYPIHGIADVCVSEANAAIIAAVPEMLALISDLQAELERVRAERDRLESEAKAAYLAHAHCPCDPDITVEQTKAWTVYQPFFNARVKAIDAIRISGPAAPGEGRG